MALSNKVLSTITNNCNMPALSDSIYSSTPWGFGSIAYPYPHWTDPFNAKIKKRFGDRVTLCEYPGLSIDKALMGRIVKNKLEVYHLLPTGDVVTLDPNYSTFESELYSICDYFLSRNSKIKNEIMWEQFKACPLGKAILREIRKGY